MTSIVFSKIFEPFRTDGVEIFSKEYNEFSSLFLLPCPVFPNAEFLNSYKNIVNYTDHSSIPWEWCLPNKKFNEAKQELSNQISQINTTISEKILNYYNLVYLPTKTVFDLLQPMKINKDLHSILPINAINDSFKANENGFANVPEYIRTSSVTGRTNIVSGANILHLKKKDRNIIESRWGSEGSVMILDYQCLEPRVLLAINQTRNNSLAELPRDIYKHILETRFKNDSSITRKDIKKIVLCIIYNAGKELLMETGWDYAKVNKLTDSVKEYFSINIITEQLMQEAKSSNWTQISNFYGRTIDISECEQYKLLSYFIQSTAVDVAMLGFKKIIDFIEYMEKQNEIIPIFTLHDSIGFDIKNTCKHIIPTLLKIGSIDIQRFEDKSFYMSAEPV